MDPVILSAYVSVAAAVGQIASILYLARQLKQSTQALCVATYQGDVENSIAILSPFYSSVEAGDLQLRAHQDPKSLSPAEALRWDNYMLCAIRQFDSLYYQFRVGTLESDLWIGYQAAFAARLRHGGWRDWFEAHQAFFSPALGELVRKIVPRETATVEGPPKVAVG